MSDVTEAIEKSSRAKYSAGPIRNANRDSGSARTLSRMTLIVPAMSDPMAETRKRRAGAAALCHLEAVEGRHHRGGFARRVDQDRRGRAAILRPVIEAGEHDDRRCRLHPERCRNEKSHPGGGPKTREHADDRPHQAADERVAEICRLESDRKSRKEGVRNAPSLPYPTRRRPAGNLAPKSVSRRR